MWAFKSGFLKLCSRALSHFLHCVEGDSYLGFHGLLGWADFVLPKNGLICFTEKLRPTFSNLHVGFDSVYDFLRRKCELTISFIWIFSERTYPFLSLYKKIMIKSSTTSSCPRRQLIHHLPTAVIDFTPFSFQTQELSTTKTRHLLLEPVHYSWSKSYIFHIAKTFFLCNSLFQQCLEFQDSSFFITYLPKWY